MKKLYQLSIVAFMIAAVVSCNGNGVSPSEEKSINDSLMQENRNLNYFLDVVAASMDSIIASNDMLFVTSGNEGKPVTTQQEILDNIEKFELTMARQRERIAELETLLEDTKSEHAKKMKALIATMKAQLEEKDKEIATLKDEISKRDFSIDRLQSRVSSLNEDVRHLTQRAQEQEEALTAQSDMMNEAYVFIGSKSELKSAGLLSKANILSKSKLDLSGVNTNAFKKVDIRNYTSVVINSRKPKILTQVPDGSYSLNGNGDGTTTLTISNPTAFWSVSNYLVIQTN